MKDETVVRKALHALALSFSDLGGLYVARRRLVKNHVGLGTPLHVEEQDGGKSWRPRLVVSYDCEKLGEVQSKPVPWLRPLLPFGAGIYLVRMTGQERDYSLGLNCCVGAWELL